MVKLLEQPDLRKKEFKFKKDFMHNLQRFCENRIKTTHFLETPIHLRVKLES